MKYTFLSPKCKSVYRPEFELRKCFTRSKGLAKISKSNTLHIHVQSLSKSKKTSMCSKSLTQFVISPLLSDEEKKCVVVGKSSLGYTCQNEFSPELLSDCSDESSSDSCTSSDEGEFIFK